jgi:hypothetical protein
MLLDGSNNVQADVDAVPRASFLRHLLRLLGISLDGNAARNIYSEADDKCGECILCFADMPNVCIV